MDGTRKRTKAYKQGKAGPGDCAGVEGGEARAKNVAGDGRGCEGVLFLFRAKVQICSGRSRVRYRVCEVIWNVESRVVRDSGLWMFKTKRDAWVAKRDAWVAKTKAQRSMAEGSDYLGFCLL